MYIKEPFPDESYVEILVSPEDFSANMSARLLIPFSYLDLAKAQSRGVFLMPNLVYRGNITMRREGDLLKGSYEFSVTPYTPFAPDAAEKLWRMMQTTGSPYLALNELMSLLYGSGTFEVLSPAVSFQNVTVELPVPAAPGNVTVLILRASAPVICDNPSVDEYRASFMLAIPGAVNASWVAPLTVDVYASMRGGSPYPLEEFGDSMRLYLDPLLNMLPWDSVSAVNVTILGYDYRIIGGSPPPKLSLWNSGVWHYDPAIQGRGISVEIEPPSKESAFLTIVAPALPPTFAGLYLVYTAVRALRRRRGQIV
ncbi:MAG: hypothetical protein DRO06_00595 [Thermoproteota archaeon]|nr:MAG: hypothetical protein DRO06_00595 [Candidatus Korarchaeota archaeon]